MIVFLDPWLPLEISHWTLQDPKRFQFPLTHVNTDRHGMAVAFTLHPAEPGADLLGLGGVYSWTKWFSLKYSDYRCFFWNDAFINYLWWFVPTHKTNKWTSKCHANSHTMVTSQETTMSLVGNKWAAKRGLVKPSQADLFWTSQPSQLGNSFNLT